jgi:hypothetical protein
MLAKASLTYPLMFKHETLTPWFFRVIKSVDQLELGGCELKKKKGENYPKYCEEEEKKVVR